MDIEKAAKVEEAVDTARVEGIASDAGATWAKVEVVSIAVEEGEAFDVEELLPKLELAIERELGLIPWVGETDTVGYR